MKVSLVIVAYKNGNILLDCLNSIEKYNDLKDELEVIVVDNSPINERVESFVRQSNMQNIQYIPSNNKGFGAGNNVGAKVSQGEIIGFINPDIVLIEPIFKQIYSDFKKNSNLAIEGIRLLKKDLSPGYSFYFEYNTKVWRNWTIKLWNKLGCFNGKNMFITGANLFVRKDMFMNVGMFDENIFMYFEESDVTSRIKNKYPHAEVKFNKGLKMIHLEGGCTDASKECIKMSWDSMIYYGKKNHLNYKKKVRFEYGYYKFKKCIFSLISQSKKKEYTELLEFLKQNYPEYL